MSLEGSHLLSEFAASWDVSEHTRLSGFCAAHLEGTGQKPAPFSFWGRSGLGMPKFSHLGAYILGCLAKKIFFSAYL